MAFGDIFIQQLIGIEMGMSPAPTIANLHVAIHESTFIQGWLKNPLFKGLHIDDGIGIWIHD